MFLSNSQMFRFSRHPVYSLDFLRKESVCFLLYEQFNFLKNTITFRYLFFILDFSLEFKLSEVILAAQEAAKIVRVIERSLWESFNEGSTGIQKQFESLEVPVTGNILCVQINRVSEKVSLLIEVLVSFLLFPATLYILYTMLPSGYIVKRRNLILQITDCW